MREIARRPTYRNWTMSGAAALMTAGVALAQPVEQPAAAQPGGAIRSAATPPSPAEPAPMISPFGLGAIDYSLRGYGSYEVNAQLRDDPGEVSVLRAGVDFDATMPLNERTRLRLEAGSEYANFDFRNEQKLSLAGKRPFEELSSHRLGLGIEQAIDDKWSWLARGMVRDGLEGGAKVIDGLGGDLTAGVLYQVSPGVKLGLGAMVYWRVDDSARFLPVPFVDAKVALSDHWSLDLNIPRWGGLVYTPSRDLTLRLGLGVRYQDYRLSANNQVPNGVFREFSLPLMLEADWRFAPSWTLQAAIGANVYQNFDINDDNGHDVADVRTKPAPIIMLGVKWDF